MKNTLIQYSFILIMVIFNRISYEKDGEYVFSQRYNFVLEDSIACKTTFTLDTIRCQNGLSEQI
jgi:hypothetical protein